MRAAVCTKYGPPDVVEVRDVSKPVPRAGDVLVRVRAAAVSSGDCRIRGSNFPPGFSIAKLGLGIRGPRNPILGNDFAGDVEAVGGAVTRFKPGDAVVGVGSSTHAEFVSVPEKGTVVPKPSGLGCEEAASIPFGGITALYFLRDLGRIRPDHRVAVYGASGAVGTAAVQLAKHFGAAVTGVTSAANADLVRSLGADEVIDYKRETFPRAGAQYDLILDTVGKVPFATSKAALAPDGRHLAVVAALAEFLLVPWTALTGKKRFMTGVAITKADDLALLMDLARDGKLKPVIDKTYPLERIVAAHEHVETGRKRGSVVIRPSP